ncbi:MAG: GDSL-type esterase/lipase family protein [Kiritimatiellia bacterium]
MDGKTLSHLAVWAALSLGAAVPGPGPGTWFVPAKGTANVVGRDARPARAARRYTVAFLGGSITEMHGFRPRVMELLRQRHPDVAFTELAAGLSSTCSDTGAFRLEEDLLAKGRPDVFIVEAAVNDDQDGHFDRTHCIRGMEGAIRHVRDVNPACAVVVGLMVNRGQYDQLMRGQTPVPYAAHAAVARHYGAAVADVGSALVASAQAGGLDWNGYRDCHPSPAGCDFGAKVVLEALATVFDPLNPPAARAQPPPLDAGSYANGRAVPPAALKLGAGWRLSRPDWERIPGCKRDYFCAGPAIWSETPGAELAFAFTGTACGALLTAGPDAGDLEVAVDGGEPKTFRLRADYGPLHYPYTQMLADDLAPARHEVRLRVRPSSGPRPGNAVRIHRLYVNGSAD